MANDHNIKNYTAADIERYHKGLMSTVERHTMEKAALDDPFLADAIDGYSVDGVNVSADIDDLRNRLSAKQEKAKVISIAPVTKTGVPWLRAAAIIVFIAGASLVVYKFGFDNKRNEIAQERNDAPTVNSAETGTNQVADTIVTNPPGKDSQITGDVATSNQPAKVQPNKDIRKDEKTDEQLDRAVEAAVPKQSEPSAALSPKPSVQEEADYKKKLDNVKKESQEQQAQNEIASRRQKSSVERNADVQNAESYMPANRLKVFRGRVTDAQNNALPFANVTNPVDNVGTYADASGNFTLTSPDSVLNVQVRSLGFENNNIQLRNELPVNQITLQEDRSLSARVLDTVQHNASRSRNNMMVLEQAEPADGWNKYDTYIANNLNIPENYRPRQVGIREVELSFEVNKLGQPINIKVEKSLCETCDKEAIRLVKDGPKWKRKARKGRTTVTISF